MNKLSIKDLAISGKKVLMRADFNVPLDGERNILDATRIEATLPSIRYVLDQGGSLVLMSHLGRPKNMFNPDLSLDPVAKMLAKILNQPVQMAPDCTGSIVSQMVDKMKPKDIVLLENLRFHRAEEHPEEDPQFVSELASFGDVYVNDAFGTSHRKHASTYSVPLLFKDKAAAGFLLEKEIHFLGETLNNSKRPLYAILGGAKISTKIGVIKALLGKVDKLLIGGAMAYTFLKAQGFKVGNSLVEENKIALAKELNSKKIIFPKDFVCVTEVSKDSPIKLVDIEKGIPDGYQGVDIGPKTIENFGEAIKNAKTLIWNGPLGIYEFERFAQGTRAIAKQVCQLPATTIVGGGDLIAALKAAEVLDKFTHVSTGGGATLEYIEFGTLPGIEALSDKKLGSKNIS